MSLAKDFKDSSQPRARGRHARTAITMPDGVLIGIEPLELGKLNETREEKKTVQSIPLDRPDPQSSQFFMSIDAGLVSGFHRGTKINEFNRHSRCILHRFRDTLLSHLVLVRTGPLPFHLSEVAPPLFPVGRPNRFDIPNRFQRVLCRDLQG